MGGVRYNLREGQRMVCFSWHYQTVLQADWKREAHSFIQFGFAGPGNKAGTYIYIEMTKWR